MRVQIAKNELIIELDEKDLNTISRKYNLQYKFKFSILDDEALLISLRMEGSDNLCTMYEDNELIIFLPFTEFEKWLNSESSSYHVEKGKNASNNMSITLKKEISIPKIKTFGVPGQYKISNSLTEAKFNYN